jgi:hypothetical protein
VGFSAISYINVALKRPEYRFETGGLNELSLEDLECYGLTCVQDPNLARQLLSYDPTISGEFHNHPVRKYSRGEGATSSIAEERLKETAA